MHDIGALILKVWIDGNLARPERDHAHIPMALRAFRGTEYHTVNFPGLLLRTLNGINQ